MNSTAIVDVVCAVFLCIFLPRILLSSRGEQKNRWEFLYCLLSVLMLVNDSLAYSMTGPEYPPVLRYMLAFVSMHGVGVIILAYTCYTESLIREKTEPHPWFFRVLKTAELLWLAASVYESVSRHMITFTDGELNLVYSFPLYIDIAELILLFAVPVYAIVIRKKIGVRMAALFSIFAFGPILATILFTFAEIDLSYPLGAFTFLLMDLLIQEQLVREAYEKLNSAYHRIGQQHEELQDAMIRNDALYHMIDGYKWSYGISAGGEVVTARYDDEVIRRTDADNPENPMAWVSILHPDDRERVRSEFLAAARDVSGNTPYETVYRMRSKEGTYIWERTSGRLIPHADGTAELFGMSIDITAQMEDQQKRLLGAMPLSNDVLAKANIGMWAFELDEGHPPRMYDDETMLGLVGLDHQVPPEEAYHAWYDNIDADSYDLVNDAVNKMISGEHAEVQYPWHFPDGRTIIVRCGGVRNFEYAKGIRIEGTHQDVTQTLHFDDEQRKREEQQRNDEIARIKAEASDKAKTEFLFNMSHDIRTPMNAILGYTDIALNHMDEHDRVSDSLRKIKTSGGHLLSLINDILEMSRIEAGRMEISNAPVDIREATEGIINMSQALASTRDVTFRAVVGDLKNPYVYSDELHINQIIINLISNAIKYTPPGGTVDYRIEQTGAPVDGIAEYRFTVKDNGIGMSDEFQGHLYESFAREQTATVSKQEGAGLGLAIVKRIVDLIGGAITAKSQQGVGSEFTVELPLAVMGDAAIQELEASHHTSGEAREDLSLDGKTVLLVEDNEMNREIATEILEETGLRIDSAEDGALAVRKVMEHGAGYYDFILMDIQMPVMDGYEATAEIRKLPGGDKVPIIALSANAFKEDVEKSLSAGMNDHVAKPINIRELFRALSKQM